MGNRSAHSILLTPTLGPCNMMMCCRHSSTCRYAHREDLEPGVQCSRAMDRRTDGAVTCMFQPPLQLIPSFQWPRAFSAHSDRPETRQEQQAQVVQCAHSESERVVAWFTLNITKTTLVVFKSLTARADISESYKRLPRKGLALVCCHRRRCDND